MGNRDKARQHRPRRIFLAQPDVEAARRLLALFALEKSDEDRSPPGRQERSQQAQAELDLRYRRFEVLGERFAGEAPFTILLALYATEERESKVNFTRLAELSLLSHATTLRWVDILVQEGWIERRSHPDDKRQALVGLSARARSAIDELFA